MPYFSREKIHFEVYCQKCGKGICDFTKVKDDKVYVKCPYCLEEKKEIEQKKDEIKELQEYIKEMMKQLPDTLTIVELERLKKMGIINKFY